MAKIKAGILFECNGKFLVCRSTPDPKKGPKQRITWGIPKGRAEKGETPLDAAIREVREETGINAEPHKDKLNLFMEYNHKGNVIYVFHVRINNEIPTDKMFCETMVPDRGYPEVDMYQWLSKEQAYRKCSNNHMKQIFN